MSFLETKHKDKLYLIFRVGIGALFLMFGLQKLFGLWGMPGGAATFGTLVWVAGAAELLIGMAVAVGVFTRLASLFGVIEMAVAYVMGHALVAGWNPMVNMGTPALLFLLAFLVTFAYGAGKASLERKMMGKEMF